MQNKIFKVNINELAILLLSLTYAGISSNVFFGFRVVDILIVLFVILKLKNKINQSLLLLILLWFFSIVASTVVGVLSNASFISSDLRFFTVFILAVFLGHELGCDSNFNFKLLYFKLLVLTLLIYCLIPFFDALRFYYIPEAFQKDEHVNTIFGPSLIIINYLYVYLVLIKKKQPLWFYIIYLLFAIIIYNFRISRTDFAIMMVFFIWSILYRFGERIKVKHILIGAVLLIISSFLIYLNESERIEGLFNPSRDSSFVYRILSNTEFIKKFGEGDMITKIFGFGMGSTIDTYFNDWFGLITLTILDNGPLTVLMKSGYFGLAVFIPILLFPLKKINFWKKIILIFPILLSLALFSHVIYNLLYILGFYFVCFKLRTSSQSI